MDSKCATENKQPTKYAIVTGAASGIGKAITELLLSNGVNVFALDKSKTDNLDAINLVCDTSSVQSVQDASEKIKMYTDKVDYVFLPAGILCFSSRYYLEDLPLDEWNNVLDVNLTGVMLCMKAFVPLLKNNKHGAIITFSSEQVAHPIPKSAPYLISKAGVEALTKLAALEFMPANITVNCIRAATVDTNFLSTYVKEPEIRQKMRDDMNDKMPFGIISAADIANLSWYIASNDSNKITGQIITIDSGVLLQ